jgi:hypothetical protein
VFENFHIFKQFEERFASSSRKGFASCSSSSTTRMRINGGKVGEFELRNSNSVTQKRISETKEEEPTVDSYSSKTCIWT